MGIWINGEEQGATGGGSGDVVGPASATDGVPALFDGATGKLLKNSTPTGTGSPVLATSPTLVTPAIGTPSSGVLTNCTGLPLASLVTLVASSTVIGADVATISISSLGSLTGKYQVEARLKITATTASLNMYINGDTTASNYRRGRMSSNASGLEDSSAGLLSPSGAGFVIIRGEIEIINGVVAWQLHEHVLNTTGRFLNSGFRHITATYLDSIEITAAGSVIDDGSTLTLRLLP